jgi:hypothetical protein
MLALKYLLMILGVGLFGSASALVVYDIFLAAQLRRLLRRNSTDESGAEVGPCLGSGLRQADFVRKINFLGRSARQEIR